jgi:hypothetical protein
MGLSADPEKRARQIANLSKPSTEMRREWGRRAARANGFYGEKVSNEEILSAIRAAAIDGEPPTSDAWRNDGRLPSWSTIYHRFGSWNKAIEAAGFTPRKQHEWQEKITEDEAISSLRDYYSRTGNVPSVTDWAGMSPSETVMSGLFGSWTGALAAAGLDISDRPMPGKPYWTRERLIELMRKWSDENDGKTPRQGDLNEQSWSMYRTFGTWDAAVRAAGLRPIKPTRQECIDAIRANADSDNIAMSGPQWNQLELWPSVGQIKNMFGSWNKAVEAAGVIPRQPGDYHALKAGSTRGTQQSKRRQMVTGGKQRWQVFGP